MTVDLGEQELSRATHSVRVSSCRVCACGVISENALCNPVSQSRSPLFVIKLLASYTQEPGLVRGESVRGGPRGQLRPRLRGTPGRRKEAPRVVFAGDFSVTLAG